MSFNDIFKNSFLEGYSGDISINYFAAMLGVTCLLPLYLFFIYRVVTRKTFYSKNMNISLSAISIITAAIIITIQSSIVISLGMVGALSIVRFRTAIKDPMDLMFLFWSISIGIICGAGLIELAIVTSLVLTVAIFVLNVIPVAKAPMMLVFNSTNIEIEEEVIQTIRKYSKFYKVKSRNFTGDHLDMVIEVRVKDEKGCARELAQIEDINSLALLAHDGEVTF